MAIISFTNLDRKTIILLIFIILIFICYSIIAYFNQILPYENVFLDSISQILLTLPYFIKKIYKKRTIFKIKLSKYSKTEVQKAAGKTTSTGIGDSPPYLCIRCQIIERQNFFLWANNALPKSAQF